MTALRRACPWAGFFVFFAVFIGLALPAPAYAAHPGPVLYRASAVGESRILTGPGGETVTYVKKGTRIDVLEVDPCYAYVRAEGYEGYMWRSRLQDVRPVDKVNTPPYGVVVYRYLAKAGDNAPVRDAPGADGAVLNMLHDGAQLGLIGFENGWARVIFKRQYGYVDARDLKALTAVKASPDEQAMRAPISVYTTYYKTDDTEANQGRMANIATACGKLSAITLYPGQSLDFNRDLGPYSQENGYHVAPVLTSGKLRLNYGGGTCQVSSTLYNVALQLPGMTIVYRRAHGANGASYLPHGVDAAVGSSTLNLIFRNDYGFPVSIDAASKDGALTISFWRAEDLAALRGAPDHLYGGHDD